MKFRYREPHEMKDSGVEWLGMIPKEWEIRKLKTFFTFEKGKNAALYTNEYIGNNEGEYPVYSGQTENNGIMGKINSYDYDTEECIFTTTVGAKVMTPMLLKNKFSLSQNCLIMIGNHKINNRYTYNLLFPMFRYEKSIIPTHMQPSLRIDDLNKFKISYPKLNEQEKIATFLDQKTAEFDNIIAKKQAFIDKLTEAKKSLISEVVTGKKKITVDNGKLIVDNRKAEDIKDSGVEWLGMIPKEWGTSRLGLYAFVTKLAGFEYTNYFDGNVTEVGEVPIVRAGNIKMNRFIEQESEFISMEMSLKLNRCALNKKCILMTFIGAGIGEVALFDKEKRYHLAPNISKIEILKGKDKVIQHKYLLYYLMSNSGQEEVNKIKKASAQPSLSMETIRGIKFTIPNAQEQQLITCFLDEKIAKIDNTIENIKVQIEKLKEAKQSLISEAVTGQIEVM